MANRKFEIKYSTQEHIDKLKGNFREADKAECLATSGRSADEAIQTGLDVSLRCWTALLDDEPVLAFGVAPATNEDTKGVPWLLGTDKIREYEVMRAVSKYSDYYISLMLEYYSILENFVDVRNKISINWLKRCGFSFDEAKPYGVEGKLFNRFFMKSKENHYV